MYKDINLLDKLKNVEVVWANQISQSDVWIHVKSALPPL